ncbi:MAG: sulfotransferase domain-containing protein [bacterium]|nr:sulfotransferase domain-containing protein [bacterium]
MSEIKPGKYSKFREPAFLIIGSQKSGTTSLYLYITRHPRIRPARRKEVHFFDENYEKGLEWYRSFFPPVKMFDNLITGEASPYYLFHPLVPERIRATYPDIKLIVLLRNPVDRAYSQYHHNYKRNQVTSTFEEALASEPRMLEGEKETFYTHPGYQSLKYKHFSYRARGMYFEQLNNWSDYFPRENFLILQSEAFFKSPGEGMERVFTFLGVDNHPMQEFEKWHHFGYPPMEPGTRERLADYFRPYNRQLYEFPGIDFRWDDES